MGIRTISTLGGLWSNASSWTEALVPTAADDVVATVLSSSLTIDVNAFCRSMNFTDYVRTLTASGKIISIGDGTAGANNIALKFVPRMTLSMVNCELRFLSTSTTIQSIDFGGKKPRSVFMTFDGIGGSWRFDSAINTGDTTSNIVLVNGSLNSNGFAVATGTLLSSNVNTRSLTLGTSTWTISAVSGIGWNLTNTSGLTFSGANSTIVLSDKEDADKTFAGGSQIYGTVNVVSGGAGIVTFTGSNTFAKLVRYRTGAKTIKFTAGTTTTLTGAGISSFFSNSSGNVFTIASTSNGNVWNLSKSDGVVNSRWLTLRDSVAGGGATFNALNTVDVSGNSGWIITPPPFGFTQPFPEIVV